MDAALLYPRNYGAVAAAKAALESCIRQLAIALAPAGITGITLRVDGGESIVGWFS